MLVVHSNRDDVYEHLAAEDAMLDDDSIRDPLVFIYRNRDAVVLGKNQNPWRECAVGEIEAAGIKLARRVSGGGAVFHDAGNINISCILPRGLYRRDDMLNTFIAGLAALGVRAEIAGTTSLAVGGRKISGNAFCYRRDRVLHHGTFLWQSDLEKLRRALVPEVPDMETRAVASVPMPVVNLAELVSSRADDRDGGDAAPLIESLVAALARKWDPARAADFSPFDLPDFQERVQKMKSWEWLYGATPDFSCVVDSRMVHVHRGIIRGVEGEPGSAWIGRRFGPPSNFHGH